MEDKVVDVYCHMTMATTAKDACGDGGWTLVIKMDGNKVTLLEFLSYLNPFRQTLNPFFVLSWRLFVKPRTITWHRFVCFNLQFSRRFLISQIMLFNSPLIKILKRGEGVDRGFGKLCVPLKKILATPLAMHSPGTIWKTQQRAGAQIRMTTKRLGYFLIDLIHLCHLCTHFRIAGINKMS